MKKLLLFGAMALSTATFAQVPNYVPTNGLVGWWPFNGNANDESGNGNNGTVNGATLTVDRNSNANSAYYFDGVDNEITISSFTQFDVNENFSISLWFKTSVNCGSSQYCGGMISQMGSTAGAYNGKGYQIGYDNTGLWKFEYNTLATPQPPIHFYNSTQIVDGNWHNMIVIVDKVNETIRLFNDGVLEGTVSQAWFNNSTLNDNPLFFGMLREQNFFFGGDLDDIGIWNRALTECEIADLYNSQLGFLNTTATQTETALDSYTWTVNNQTYNQSGTYTAVIPNEAGCDSTITLNLTMQFTGIGENESFYVAVYPNPTTSFLTIEGVGIQNKEYKLVDIQGKFVLSGTFKTNKETLDLKTLARGQYMLRIEGKEMKVVKE